MSTAFSGVKPFPGQSNQAAAIGHNSRMPLEEQVVGDFVDGIPPDLAKRIRDLVEASKRAKYPDSEELAGKYSDFIKMSLAAVKAVEAERERHNRPLLTAQRALKARADGYVEPLQRAIATVRKFLDAYVRKQQEVLAEQRRQAEEQARVAREAAEAERQRQIDEAIASGQDAVIEEDFLPAAAVEVEVVEIEQPVVRGDYGARLGTTTSWCHEIISVRQLPDRILKHAKVVEAIDKVLAAEIRGGTREIKGCRIWSEQKAAVR